MLPDLEARMLLPGTLLALTPATDKRVTPDPCCSLWAVVLGIWIATT